MTRAFLREMHGGCVIQGSTRILNTLAPACLALQIAQKERYDEIAAEMRHMLVRVGWKEDFVAKSVPILPISGWIGDNLIAVSTNMPWYTGQEVINMKNETVKVRRRAGRGGLGWPRKLLQLCGSGAASPCACRLQQQPSTHGRATAADLVACC